MTRAPGPSARLQLTLSYVGLLILAGAVLLGVAWVFLLRGAPTDRVVPSLGNLLRAFDPHNFGPVVFVPAAALAMGFLLVFGLLGGWMLSGRMLRPLARMNEATRLAASGSLSHRIRLPGRRDEFRELADSFDAMLARLEAQVAGQQRFAANASHELRTPLATTQALLQAARDDLGRDAGPLIERLLAVNARAIALTEALLLLSAADQRAFERETVDLSLIVEEAVETLLPLAEQRRVAIDAGGEVAFVAGSEALLSQMVANLLRNAIVHNLTGGGSVRVAVAHQADGVTLTVENTGEMLSPELVATLTERFRRGADRTGGQGGGVGLGLAIVESIVQAHDGRLGLTPGPAGGLCVTAHFAAARSQQP